jgi:hypothetical protein
LLVAQFAAATMAKADSPDPVLPLSGSAVINTDGTKTLTVEGDWVWTTHHSNCNLNRFAVGWAMDWNDTTQPGNVVGTANSVSVDVGAAADNGRNPADNTVHHYDGPNPPRCGTYVNGRPEGNWGPLSHTYPEGTQQFSVCVVTYDVHSGNKKGEAPAPKDGDLVAGGSNHNGDNSVQSNKNTPLGNGCFAFQVPTLTTQASQGGPNPQNLSDTATLSEGTSDIGGSLTFKLYGPNDADCSGEVQDTRTVAVSGNGDYASTLDSSHATYSAEVPGTYRWAVAYSGDAKNAAVPAQCNQENESTTVSRTESPAVHIEKDGPDLAHVGDTITYTFDVTNVGGVPLTGVTVTDPNCNANPELVSKTGGNQDDTLSGDEVWHYTCQHTVTAEGPDPLPNTATVSTDQEATDTDSHSVDIIHPAITIDKTVDHTDGHPGDTFVYSFKVTNTGDVALHDVHVTDDKLGDIGTIDNLAVGESKTLTKSTTLQGNVTNVATVVGKDTLDKEVSATDTQVVDGVAAVEAARAPDEIAATGILALELTAMGLGLILLGYAVRTKAIRIPLPRGLHIRKPESLNAWMSQWVPSKKGTHRKR